MNFDPNDFIFTKTAEKVLKTVDAAINLYASRNLPRQRLILYPSQWLTLDRALRKQSDDKVSLDTHTYRGIRLERPPGGWK